MGKTGLIVEGGGMKCAYAAGVLDAFLDENITFDYTMGVSAGAADVVSFLGGQRDRNRRYYCEHLKDPRYFGPVALLREGNLFGLDYIYSTLSNEGGKDPIDYEAVMSNPAEMVFPATEAATGRPHYFHKKDLIKNNYRAIKATCALPVLCKPIEIDGSFYFDGGVSDSIPLKKAFADGCDRVVIIMSKPRTFVMQPQKHRLFYTMALRKYPHIIHRLNHRHEAYRRQIAMVRRAEKEGRVKIYCPSSSFDISTYTMDAKILNGLYDSGYDDGVRDLPGLRKFLNEADKG